MSEGKIEVAQQEGVYLLRLSGDVRVTLCSSISDYIDRIFSGEPPTEVYVDLLDAECIDSTTLGLLAKLALYTERELGIKPRLLCVDNNILRILQAMDIERLFDIYGLPAKPAIKTEEVAVPEPDERTVRQQVLEAHRLLVKLNPELMGEFVDLINTLESPE